MRCLGLRAADEWFAIDVTRVQKVVRNIPFTPLPVAPYAVVGLANLKGSVVTLLSFEELIGRERGQHSRAAVVFKTQSGERGLLGLLVERPDDIFELDDEKILPPPVSPEEGSCILGIAEADGKLFRIINSDEIISAFKGGAKNEKLD